MVKPLQGLIATFIASSLMSCATASADPAPTTRPSGSVTGAVTSPSEVPLSEMVVYLDSPEANRVIDVPKATAKVSQKGAKFSPALTLVCVGQTVEFLNDEDHLIEHNVFSNAPPKRFDLGIYRPGESRSVTFDKPGAVFLYCSIHRYMDGVVFIAPTPYSSLVAPDGTYRIDGAPPGIWVVKTWQRRRRFPEVSVPVLIEAGKTATTAVELRKP
jgi:plastocyanin